MKKEPLLFFSFDKKKCVVGVVLGIISMTILYLFRNTYIGESTRINYAYLVGIPFLFLFTVVGAIKICTSNTTILGILSFLWCIACAVASIFWTMAAVEAIAIWRMPTSNLCLNIFLFFSFVCLVYTIVGNVRISINSVMLLQFCIAIINGYVWQFRGREILFSDLTATKTAIMVAKEYVPSFSLRMALGLSLWLLVFFCQFSLPTFQIMPKRKTRCTALITATVLCIIVVFSSRGLTTKTWGGVGSSSNGFYINFLLSIRDSVIEEPAGYSVDVVDKIADEYSADAEASAENYPNVIVIMNESFADLRVLGENFHTNQPVMPFWDSLHENTVKGFALASVYGGSTANSEFEFLTGHTTGFLPTGSIAYQQYISEDIYTLAWLFRHYGYSCFATHPYNENSWSRKHTYPLLGFEESTFIDDYPREQLLRNWISDQEMYEYILERLEVPSQEPKFIFGITMQNHGGYGYVGDNYAQTIDLEGCEVEFPYAEQYLTLINKSDESLNYLLTALEDSEEETVVLFFGDHLPGLESAFYNSIHGGDFVTLDEQMLKYTVPFLIWANYDIPESTVPCTSLNFLGRYLLDVIGIELPAYYQFLAELESNIPSMNSLGYFSLSNNAYIPYQEAEGSEKEWLLKYAKVQYNSMFDLENRSDIFFGKYLPGS